MVFRRLFNIVRSHIPDIGSDVPDWEKKSQEFKDAFEHYKKKFEEGDIGGGSYDDKDYDAGSDREFRDMKNKSRQAEWFEALEMEKTEEWKPIKKQYRKMIMKYHPDKFMNDEKKKATAQKISSKINVAYSELEKIYGPKANQ